MAVKIKNINLEGMRKIIGKLRTIRSNTAIAVESMEFNPASKRTLAGILQGDRITHDNQRLLIEKLLISVEGREQVEAGQHSMQQRGNTYIMPADTRHHPAKFSAEFKLLAPSRLNSTKQYLCEMTLGNIELDLSNSPGQVSEDGFVLYQNVHMILYPIGKYSTKVLD